MTNSARVARPALRPSSENPESPQRDAIQRQLSRSWRLPEQPHELIGREQDLSTVCEVLLRPECRMLTLLGVGGIGKTRLALAAAAALSDSFRDGICFVDLTRLVVASEVPSLLAVRLGLQVERQSAMEQITDFLSSRQLLLVLDNLEQVLPAASMLGELLERCPDVTILATSREPLHLRWEQRLVLGSLDVPDLHLHECAEELRANPSVALFLQRSRAVNLRFQANDETLRQIAAICVRLEGIPLAIELAAARTNTFKPAAILDLLEAQPSFLRQSAPDAPARHQSLEATLEWSYNLLSPGEREVFRRLGVFAAGFTLDAAEAVMAGKDEDSADVLEDLASLIDKGMVTLAASEADPGRYYLLATMRAYAREQLQLAGEVEQSEQAHAEYFLSLAERESADLRYSSFLVFSPAPSPTAAAPERPPWPILLDVDFANMRAALHWAEEHDPVVLVRLAGALARYWWVRGRLPEGAQWLEKALEQCPEADPVLRCRALGGLGPIYRQQGDYDRAYTLLDQAVALCRTLNEPQLLTAQLIDLGTVLVRERLPEGMSLVEESLQQAQAVDDTWGIAAALAVLGMGEILQRRGEPAETYLSESEPLFRRLGDRRSVAVVDLVMARAISLQGDARRALPFIEDGLRVCQDVGQESLIPLGLEMSAGVLSKMGAAGACARLLGAADGLRERGYTRIILEQASYEDTVATLSEALDAETRDAAMAEGRHLSGEEAIAAALDLVARALASPTDVTAESKPQGRDALSKREQEVLALLREGYTNKKIGQELGISENTAKLHVTSIFRKLGIKNRFEAISLATQQDPG